MKKWGMKRVIVVGVSTLDPDSPGPDYSHADSSETFYHLGIQSGTKQE